MQRPNDPSRPKPTRRPHKTTTNTSGSGRSSESSRLLSLSQTRLPGLLPVPFVVELAVELARAHFDGIGKGDPVELVGIVGGNIKTTGAFAGFSEGGEGVEIHG